MQQQPRLPLWFLVVNWALIAAAFVLGAVLGGRNTTSLPEPERSTLDLVFREVMESHIEPPDPHEWLEQTLQDMVQKLDDYSRYIPPQDAPQYDEDNTGQYQGIGASLMTTPDAIVVGYPYADGPADRAGLLPGDVVVRVDDQELDTPELRARAVEFVRGPADTDVRLTVLRDGQRLAKVVRRGDVQSPCVRWVHYPDPAAGLGYLHLADFHPSAAEQVLAAIARLQQDGALHGLVIDLRFDGGGSLDACLTIARTFIRDGIIATQRGRNGKIVETYETRPEICKFADLPLVVLVNEHSASASEVLSGALQDHERATIVGVRTRGKGYVNTVYSWQNHGFRLKLTTGSYRTPSGRNIERSYRTNGQDADAQHGGIPPDRVVPVTPEQNLAIRRTLDQATPPDKFAAAYAEVAQRYGVTVAMPPDPATDAQLAAALAELVKRVERRNETR